MQNTLRLYRVNWLQDPTHWPLVAALLVLLGAAAKWVRSFFTAERSLVEFPAVKQQAEANARAILEIQTHLLELRTSVKEIQLAHGGVGELKSDVSELKSDMREVRQTLQTTEVTMAGINSALGFVSDQLRQGNRMPFKGA